MVSIRWVVSFLLIPFLWRRAIPLPRPGRINWNPGLCPRTVLVNGHNIYYAVKGEGEPLILIHGYGAGMWVWEKQIDVLSRDYRVYALDLLGHGFSDRPKISYTPETYFHFLREFMDAVGISRATLIGNSMGGGVAWGTALFFPERVNRLILIDCIPPDVLDQVGNDSFKTLAAIRHVPLLPYLVLAGRTRNSIMRVLEECVTDVKRVTPEVLDRQYQLSRIRGTTWVLYSTLMHGSAAGRLKDDLSRVDHPTLLIWGEKDLIFPPSVGEELHHIIRGSRFQIIARSGHIPMWETPDEVNRAILAFLKGKPQIVE
jgi:pimeloyl-ACP methyl ester carboxylesterase